MENKKIKIGFIGCGWIVEHAHIPAFSKLEDVTISAVFDIEIKRASKLASIYNIEGVFDNINEFFKSGIDAVVIATPNSTHFDYSIEALKHGLHVICEKPITVQSVEARQIIDMAIKENKLFLPGFVNRFRCDILKLRELIQAKRIGDIEGIQAGWLRRSGIPRPGTWFTNKAYSGGGVLIDIGSHVIDICLMIIGDKKPTSSTLNISAQDENTKALDAQWFNSDYTSVLQMDVESTAIAKVEFETNIHLDLHLSWAAGTEGDCTYFIVHGSKGTIKLKTLFGFSNDRLWKDDQIIVEDSTGTECILFDRESNNAMNAFCNMARYFVDAVRGTQRSYLTSTDGLRTVELTERLYNSISSNNTNVKAVSNGLEGLKLE